MEKLKQRTERQVQQKEKQVGFGEATVHELKTLLTAVIVSTELLAEEFPSDPKSMSTRLIQNIIRNARSLDEKLSNFAEMAGLLAGDFSFQPEYLDIGPVIHTVTAQVYPITQSKKQSLTVALSPSLPPVKAHRQYLEQILLNLLSNASKFTPEGGRIRINATRLDSALLIEVMDNGIGIPEEKQEMVFQPYYQVIGGGGSGLGLAITRFLVELHGGRIWLESASGKGSRFFCSLPLSGGIEGKWTET